MSLKNTSWNADPLSLAKMKPRVIVIVLDSVGIGALPDAALYNDTGADTLGHIDLHCSPKLPSLTSLGLGRIRPLHNIPPSPSPKALYGKMAEASAGKDTVTGHWELMGIVMEKPLTLFPDGFPQEILTPFLKLNGLEGYLCNQAASGTEVIARLGDEHLRTGFPIVYTSADSVFQIAAHERLYPPERLYKICRITRELLDPWRVGRVIARPFIGERGSYTRTTNRKDFPLEPIGESVLDRVSSSGLPVRGIGKIGDIFAGRGLTHSLHIDNNRQGMEALVQEMETLREGFIFVNLVDFDMLYGHRNDGVGYARALEEFDSLLGEWILPRMGLRDLLIITADHGCDPYHPGTDHTREYVPLLAFSPSLSPRPLGTRESFADLGATVLSLFSLPPLGNGEGFLTIPELIPFQKE